MAVRHYTNNGSALLIALVLMGVLLTLSLGVSQLVIGLMRDNRLLLERAQAWYAAESALEHALLEVTAHPPGFEKNAADETLGPTASYGYSIKAVAQKIPVKEPFEIVYPEDAFARLKLNESVTIPLFRGTASEDQVKRFKVEYYLPPTLQLNPEYDLKDVDILRWKLFGRTRDGAIEVINDFAPSQRGNSPDHPSCIGTEASSGCYAHAQFFLTALGSDGTKEVNQIPDYPVEQFLKDHTENVLVLTNFVNIDLIAGTLLPREKMQLADIRYRIIELDGDDKARLGLPIVLIHADGKSGGTMQSIDLPLPRESFLPVFSFALYRTVDR